MSERRKFHLRNLDQLRDELNQLGLQLPIDEDLSVLGEQVTCGPVRLPNRFVTQPMEGFDSDDLGTPGELSFRRYRRYAEGGSALLWFEATAILREARSNPRQLWLHEGNVDAYARLVEETKAKAREKFGHDITMIVQLTHSGRYSKPTGVPEPMIAHRSPILDPKHNLPDDYPIVTDDYLDQLQDTYVSAAKLAAQAGFDGIDIKACHRYLISELLASHTREGKYGGSFENRTRMLRETLTRVRDEVPGVFVTTRMNVFDAIDYPYGFGVSKDDYNTPDLAEPIELIGQLKEIGVPLINTSIGNPYFNPHYGRPYDRPIAGVNAPAEDPLSGVARFISITRQIQETYPDLPVIAGGYTWLRHLMPYVAAGVIRSKGATLIGQGRGVFAYPDSVKDILEHGEMDPHKACVTCSGCTQIMRDGTMTGCVIRDSEIYAEQYRLGRRYALDLLQAEARRCQDCEFPTCSKGCPASIDIPRFIHAFADGDIATAYNVLREQNVLPEMCGYVCPSEVQCECGCVEQIFADKSLPIRDIQLVVSRMARLGGLTGVRLPRESTGKSVAVVGGGPSGVACAVRLLEQGHRVTIYEKNDHLGGTPDTVIPEFRYENASAEVDAILRPAVYSDRVEIRTGCTFGVDVKLDELRAKHDGVFLALGLGGSMTLLPSCSGSDEARVEGVYDAVKFLNDVKQDGVASLVGKKVAVLGAGNTAMDAAVSAAKLGAQDVYIVYRRSFKEMPAWPTERDHALAEGCHFMILTQPLSYETDSGRLSGVHVARTELGASDESGRRSPVVIQGTESLLPVDLAIEAMGQHVPQSLVEAFQPIELTRKGFIVTSNGNRKTSVDGVYAGGDLVNGGTTAVQAIREGMEAADQINATL